MPIKDYVRAFMGFFREISFIYASNWVITQLKMVSKATKFTFTPKF